MGFLDSILGLFGGGKKPAQTNQMNGLNGRMGAGAAATVRKNRQVYEARQTEVPEWAQGKSKTDIIAEVKERVVCKFVPNFEMKKIMSTNVGPDGNLIPEYDGIAGSCGALKQVGLRVAQQQGLSQAYRYVDINMAYRACCGNPMKCPFYSAAQGDMDAVNSRRR